MSRLVYSVAIICLTNTPLYSMSWLHDTFSSSEQKQSSLEKEKQPSTAPDLEAGTAIKPKGGSHLHIEVNEETGATANQPSKRMSLKLDLSSTNAPIEDEEKNSMVSYILERMCNNPDSINCHSKVKPVIKKQLEQLPAEDLQTVRNLSAERAKNGAEDVLKKIVMDSYHLLTEKHTKQRNVSLVGNILLGATTLGGTLMAYYLRQCSND